MLNGILYHFINDMRKNPVFHLYGEYMIITKIEKQKKNNKRSSVFLDDKFAFGIDDFDLFKLKLKVGIEISNEELENIRNTVIFTAAKEYAVQLTTRSSYTKKTIIEKLKMRDYDDFIIDKTIAFLEEYKLVDDFDYARRYINDAYKYKNYGTQKIKYELIKKGISSDIIDDVLSSIDTDIIEEENILPLAIKKLSGNFEYKNIMKTKRFLLSKGYSYEIIDFTISKIIKEGEC